MEALANWDEERCGFIDPTIGMYFRRGAGRFIHGFFCNTHLMMICILDEVRQQGSNATPPQTPHLFSVLLLQSLLTASISGPTSRSNPANEALTQVKSGLSCIKSSNASSGAGRRFVPNSSYGRAFSSTSFSEERRRRRAAVEIV